MRCKILKAMGILLCIAMSMICQSCSEAECMIDRMKCKFDCPSTIGMKEACEQKCNFLYDLCRSRK